MPRIVTDLFNVARKSQKSQNIGAPKMSHGCHELSRIFLFSHFAFQALQRYSYSITVFEKLIAHTQQWLSRI